jgi:hypothetical protein
MSKSQRCEIFLVASEKTNDFSSVQKPHVQTDMLELPKLYIVEDKFERDWHTIPEADVKCCEVYRIAEGCEE